MPTLRQKITSLITRRYPFLSGCGTFANSRVVHWVAGNGRGTAWARLDSGLEILVPLHDYVGKAAFYIGDLDRKISQTVGRIVRPGDHVLDVGANLGLVTLQMAHLVGEAGMVHSFEPNPSLMKMLTSSIERNQLTNVNLYNFALGAVEGELTLAFPEDNAGMGSLVRQFSGANGESIQVKVQTLSALAEKLDLSNIRLVKIDVEGFESDVFKGAHDWMSTAPPDALLFESNDRRKDGESDPVLTAVSDYGYNLFTIPKSLFKLHLSPYTENAHGERTNDMLAIRRDCENEILSEFRVLA